MPEHPLDGMAGGQRGHDLHAPFATHALEDVTFRKTPARSSTPKESAAPEGGLPGQGRRQSLRVGRDRLEQPLGTIPAAGSECRGENAKVAAEVDLWTRNERDQALDQFVRREHERGRAIAPGTLELELQAAVVQPG